jgi:hypothetical protein
MAVLGGKRCLHGKVKRHCAVCNPYPHGKLKHGCAECTPYPHGKLKQGFKECNPCPHGKLKHGCAVCTGCPHGKVMKHLWCSATPALTARLKATARNAILALTASGSAAAWLATPALTTR